MTTNVNFSPELFYFDQEDTVQARTMESVTNVEPVWSTLDQKFGDIKMYDQTPVKNYARTALAGIQEVSTLSYLYFSGENIEEVQKLIRYNVYSNTEKKYIIDNQDETELLIVMRGVYLEFSKVYSEPSKIREEIKRLNVLVVNEILPNLISNLEQYLGYLRDSSNAYTLIDRPENPSIKGKSTELRSVSDVLVGDDLFFK
jgi:hypothetical protein